MCEEFEAHQKISGQGDLYDSVVGTVRAGRGRGIASALLAHAPRGGEDGYDIASLEVDANSPTGALGLYERLGCQPDKTYALQRKFVRRRRRARAGERRQFTGEGRRRSWRLSSHVGTMNTRQCLRRVLSAGEILRQRKRRCRGA